MKGGKKDFVVAAGWRKLFFNRNAKYSLFYRNTRKGFETVERFEKTRKNDFYLLLQSFRLQKKQTNKVYL